MHSTSRYVKHWRYRPLALACLLACLPRGAMCHSLTSGTALAYLGVLARVLPGVDRRKWPRSRGGGGSPLVPLSLRLAACGLAGCGCAATATGPLDPRAMGCRLAQLLGLKISLRAASGSEIGVNRGKSAQAGYTGYMGYMGYTGYTGYIQNKRVYGVYPEQGGIRGISSPRG